MTGAADEKRLAPITVCERRVLSSP